jgi:hypothetical protein
MRTRIRDPESFCPWIRDPGFGMEKFGSGINIPTLVGAILLTPSLFTRSKLEADVAAIVGSLDASQLAEEGKQLTAFRLFLLTRRRGQQQQTEAGFPLFILRGTLFPHRFFLQYKNFSTVCS